VEKLKVEVLLVEKHVDAMVKNVVKEQDVEEC
jgi:hypothetical protein